LKNMTMTSAAMGWVGLLVIGTTISATYENKPGDPGAPPQVALSKQATGVVNLSKRPSHIIMFVHPRCPCTRASMSELRGLMEKYPDLKATVFFYRPSAEETDWEKTELWKTAASVKNITAKTDVDGQIAKANRIVTSGQVLLYDDAGHLVFSGGITGARGHVGENMGESMIEALLDEQNDAGKSLTAPVFGCRISKDNSQICNEARP